MKTTRFLAAACGAALIAGAAGEASAAVTIDGAVTGVTAHTTGLGLVINTSLPWIGSVTLEESGTFDFTAFTIGTTEDSLDWDDVLFGRDISVTFGFNSPDGASGSLLSGTTRGTFLTGGVNCLLEGGCGKVEWGAPSIFSFGDGGQFSIELFDTTFGVSGNSPVGGRFTLLNEGAPAVPEPTTWAMMILGFGAVGASMRANRRKKMTLTYA